MIFIAVACGDAPAKFNRGAVITEIRTSTLGSHAGVCLYYGIGCESEVISNTFVFEDACGKFNVGDTVTTIKK